jgi:hypothetical protein
MAITSKIWKLKKDSTAYMAIKDDSVFMVGAPNRFITVDKQGTVVYGPMSVVAGEESIKTGGMFSRLPDLVQMIPETEVTPGTHIKIPIPPVHVGFQLAADVGFFAALLV